MSEPTTVSYFALKVVAPAVGASNVKAVTAGAEVVNSTTVHQADVTDTSPANAGSRLIFQVGNARMSSFPGIADHLSASVFHFSDAESKACKSAGEAEQFVKEKHADWLADAYDWFIIPVKVYANGK